MTHKTSLTPDQLHDVLHGPGTQAEVAARVGVTQQAISYYRRKYAATAQKAQPTTPENAGGQSCTASQNESTPKPEPPT